MSFFRKSFYIATVALGFASKEAEGQRIISDDEKVYRNNPGNEFNMVMHSAGAPQGVRVTIDCDDFLITNPKNSTRVVLAPRYAFFYKLNQSLPDIPGKEIPKEILNQMRTPENMASIAGRTVVTMANHITEAHKVPLNEQGTAIRQCYTVRGVPLPGR